jgi:hypothetical protein
MLFSKLITEVNTSSIVFVYTRLHRRIPLLFRTGQFRANWTCTALNLKKYSINVSQLLWFKMPRKHESIL